MKQARQKTFGAAVPIMDAETIGRALRRIAHEIIERNPQLTHVVLAGIPSRGVEIARRIAAFIHQIRKIKVETGIIDVAIQSSLSMTFFTPAALCAPPWTPSIHLGGLLEFSSRY